MKKITKIAFLLVLAISLFGCKKEWTNKVTPQYLEKGSLYDFLKKDPELTQFVSLAKKVGYDSVLRRQALYTVLAVKNGGFSGIDTTNLVTVKGVIGMHIIGSAVYKEKMNGLRLPAVSGKYVKFALSSGAVTANNIAVTGNGDRVVNGVAYKVATALAVLPNIYQIISTDPNYSLYYKYIQSSFIQAFDPVNNIITKYDSVGKPVYKQPFKYVYTSQFIGFSKIDSEKVEQTVFIPTNAVVTKVLGLMLSARGGYQSLVIPAISSTHAEASVGEYYFNTNIPYAGDSTIVQDYLFRNAIVNGVISSLATGNNTFTSKDGKPFTVSSTQVSGEGFASNGKYYVLNDVILPGSAYRKTFMFEPRQDLPPNIPPVPLVYSPLVFTLGAKNTNTAIATNGTSQERGCEFDLGNVGGKLDFTLPFATAGKYQAVIRYSPTVNTCPVNTYYNGTPLAQNLNLGWTYTEQNGTTEVPLGLVTLAADGPVKFTFIATSPSLHASTAYKLRMNSIKLIPID